MKFKKIILKSILIAAVPLLAIQPINSLIALGKRTSEESKLNSFLNQHTITWDELKKDQQQLKEKFAAKTYCYQLNSCYKTPEEAKEIACNNIKKLNSMLINSDDPSKKDANNTDQTDDEFLIDSIQTTEQVKMLVGINTVNYDNFFETSIEGMNNAFDKIKNESVSKEKIEELRQKYKTAIDNNRDFYQNYMFDAFDIDLSLARIVLTGDNSVCKSNYYNFSSEKNIDLKLVLDNLVSKLGSDITYNEISKTDEQILRLSEYSKKDEEKGYGKYSDNKNNNELSLEDMQYFFNNKYDDASGILLDKTTFPLPVECIDEDFSEEDLTFFTAPLYQEDLPTASYGLAEFIPGYAMHAKIIGEDFSTSGDQCKLQFQFGVSDSIDPSRETLWQDVSSPEVASNEDNKIEAKYTVSTLEAKRYIAEHTFYKEVKSSIFAEKIVDDYKDGVYGEKSKTKRTKLESILKRYNGNTKNEHQEYIGYRDIRDYPIVLNSEDYVDIPVNKTYENTIIYDSSESYHETQNLKLAMFDVDTVLQTISIAWAFMDSNNKWIKIVPWDNSVKTNNGLMKVKMTISQELKAKIDVASNLFLALDKTQRIVTLFGDVNETKAQYEKMRASCKSLMDWAGTRFSINVAVEAANMTLLLLCDIVAVYLGAVCPGLVAMNLTIMAFEVIVGFELDNQRIGWEEKKQNFLYFDDALKYCQKDVDKLLVKEKTMDDWLLKKYPNNPKVNNKAWNPLFDSFATFEAKEETADYILSCLNTEEYCNLINNYSSNLGNSFNCQILSVININNLAKEMEEDQKKEEKDRGKGDESKKTKSVLTYAFSIVESSSLITSKIYSLIIYMKNMNWIRYKHTYDLMKLFIKNSQDWLSQNAVVITLNGLNPCVIQSTFDTRFKKYYEDTFRDFGFVIDKSEKAGDRAVRFGRWLEKYTFKAWMEWDGGINLYRRLFSCHPDFKPVLDWFNNIVGDARSFSSVAGWENSWSSFMSGLNLQTDLGVIIRVSPEARSSFLKLAMDSEIQHAFYGVVRQGWELAMKDYNSASANEMKALAWPDKNFPPPSEDSILRLFEKHKKCLMNANKASFEGEIKNKLIGMGGRRVEDIYNEKGVITSRGEFSDCVTQKTIENIKRIEKMISLSEIISKFNIIILLISLGWEFVSLLTDKAMMTIEENIL